MLFIISTDFNGYDQTKKCLTFLRRSHFSKFITLVVDHGTSDETREGLHNDFPGVIRIEGSSKLWWAGATNSGIRYALDNGAAKIILLNNDCYVTPKTIEQLLRLSRKEPRAIIAATQLDWHTSETITIKPSSMMGLGFPTLRGPMNLPKRYKNQQLLHTKLICGGRGVIIPRYVFENIGLLDEANLPHYWADHDFYLRSLKQGVKLFVAPEVYVYVDNTRTTIANSAETLSLREFLNTLTSIRSHRNVNSVNALFKKHYPLKRFYLIGVALYLTRYTIVYLLKRTASIFKIF